MHATVKLVGIANGTKMIFMLQCIVDNYVAHCMQYTPFWDAVKGLNQNPVNRVQENYLYTPRGSLATKKRNGVQKCP